VQVNLLDWRCCEYLLEIFFVVYRRRRRVDLPARDTSAVDKHEGDRTYHPSLWVSLAI